VCKRAFAGPSRASPTSLGSKAIAAGRSAAPADEASAVNTSSSATGPSVSTTAARPTINTQRARSPVSSTVRRS